MAFSLEVALLAANMGILLAIAYSLKRLYSIELKIETLEESISKNFKKRRR